MWIFCLNGYNDLNNDKSSLINSNNDPMKESMAMGKDLAVEQCIGHSMQLIKNAAFNSTISADPIKYSTQPPKKAKK